jgi:DNA-binding transcriptional MerR regulator
MRKEDYIPLRKALKDYLKEQGITLNDLLSVMDEDKEGIMEALSKRVYLTRKQREALEKWLSSKDLNLLLFVIQAFYILNPSGLNN